jgi:hypothetical protein
MKAHLAQVNIGRMKAPLEDPLMAGFVGRLDEINALADRSPGFVWRLQTGEGNATYLRPYDDDRILGLGEPRRHTPSPSRRLFRPIPRSSKPRTGRLSSRARPADAQSATPTWKVAA